MKQIYNYSQFLMKNLLRSVRRAKQKSPACSKPAIFEKDIILLLFKMKSIHN